MRKTGNITTVVWDFFDVIHRDPQKAWLQENGLKLAGPFAEATHLLDTGKITYDEYIARYAAASGRSAPQVHNEFRRYYEVNEDAVGLIRRLGSLGYQNGLLSNTTTSEIKPLLETHGLYPLFDEIVISSEVGLRKPDPDIFHLTVERLSADPRRTAFVDDNPDNVAAALSANYAHGFPFTDSQTLLNDFTRAGIHLDPSLAQ